MRPFKILFYYMLIAITAYTVSTAYAEQKGKPYFGRTDSAKYSEVDYGGGTVYEMTLLESELMDTNIFYIKRGIIPPGCGIGEHTHSNMEEMYIVFNAPAEFTVDGDTALLPANSSVVCPLGSSHALYNNSDETLEWLSLAATKVKGKGDENIRYGAVPGRGIEDTGTIQMENVPKKKVKMVSPATFRQARFDRTLTKPVGPAHEGKGKILNRRPWLDGNFETNWVRIGHCILPPGTSIGYHQHNGIEEVYYIMSGRGRSTVNDHTWDVVAGDAIPCTLHDSHGLYNNSEEDLDIFVFMVSMVKDKLDSKNLGDDLSDR
ncbi:cupin domain-containing protein [Candidatus Latescibacterota bacterium]